MNQPHKRLVFAGEALVDLLMWVPSLPERGGDMLAKSSSVQVGGGFNIMAAAARQGLPVLYAGGHGTGPWGDRVRAALAAEDIAILRPPDLAADTGFDVAMVEPDGERTFVEWTAEFDCVPEREAELVSNIGGGVFQGGFDALKRAFGG